MYTKNLLYRVLILVEAPFNIILALFNSSYFIDWSTKYLSGAEYKRLLKEIETVEYNRPSEYIKTLNTLVEEVKSMKESNGKDI